MLIFIHISVEHAPYQLLSVHKAAGLTGTGENVILLIVLQSQKSPQCHGIVGKRHGKADGHTFFVLHIRHSFLREPRTGMFPHFLSLYGRKIEGMTHKPVENFSEIW